MKPSSTEAVARRLKITTRCVRYLCVQGILKATRITGLSSNPHRAVWVVTGLGTFHQRRKRGRPKKIVAVRKNCID